MLSRSDRRSPVKVNPRRRKSMANYLLAYHGGGAMAQDEA
jgi:hypothetical protein